jgi:tetratricopeptide (TPR) repeat protein
MNEKRFRFRCGLLAFTDEPATIEGMSLGGSGVNFVAVSLVGVLAVARPVDVRAQPKDKGTITQRAFAIGEGDLPDGYLVTPFQNASPVKQLDWMSGALAVTVAEKLEAIPTLRPVYGASVLEPPDVGGAGPRGIEADRVARRALDRGAKWVVTGSFARPNWKSEVALRVFAVEVDATGAPRLALRAEAKSIGERNALFDQLDGLLVDVVKKLKWVVPDDGQATFRRRPTKDLYAFTLYGRGLGELYGLGDARDLGKAEKTLKRVALIDPKFAEARRVLGLVYLESGERGKAAGQYAYALDLRPGYYAAQAGLAKLYRQEGARQKAIDLAEKALEARPWDVEVREMLGELLWEAADIERALVELERVTAIQPKHLAARRTLALIYAAKGAVNDLAAELERVQELAPDDVEVRLDLGSAYGRMGDNAKAIASYEEVLKRQPKNVQALKLLGDCYRRQKDPEKAIAVYQKVKKLAPEDPRPYFLLGAAYQEAGDDARAEAIFQEAQQFKRYLGEAWTNLGSLAYRRGDLAKANWYLSRAIVRAPSRPKAHFNYALVLSAKKDRERALDELKIAGDLDPQDPEIRYLAGVILLRMGRLDEAKAQFAEALKRSPEHADAKHNLALLDDLERRYGGERSATGSK